jgi:hypothetical protein
MRPGCPKHVIGCFANSFAISAAEKQVEMRSGGGDIPMYRDYRVINHQEIEQSKLASLSFVLCKRKPTEIFENALIL